MIGLATRIFLCSLILCSSARNLSDYTVLRLQPSTTAQVEWVQRLHRDPSLDFWSTNEVMVNSRRAKTLKEQLTRARIVSTTLITNVQATINAERTRQRLAAAFKAGDPISFHKYLRYEEIVSYLQYVVKTHSSVATLHNFGTSTEGRQMYYINISTGGNETRPLIIVDATVHAREWVTCATALHIIQQLVENPRNADLIASVDWHIIPLMNPDGYEYSHTRFRLWRKTRSSTLCDDVTECGVDGNRNFDHAWNEGSSSPCSDVYAGPYPFSEPETRALRDHVLAHAERTRLYLSLHSFGNLILYPWADTRTTTDDWKELQEVGERAKAAIMGSNGRTWTVGPAGRVLYLASGISCDWVRHDAGVKLTYTVELQRGGTDGFDMPASQLPQEVSNFFPAMRVFGEHVASPFYDKASLTANTQCLSTTMIAMSILMK